MNRTSQPAPQGLPKLGVAVLLTFLMILGAVLMHTLMGHAEHAEAMPAMASGTSHSAHTGTVAHGAAVGHTPVVSTFAGSATAMLSGAAADCGGLCAMICSLMGMACLMVLVLFAITWLRGRTSRALYALSKLLAVAPMWARCVIPQPSVILTALSIIRV